jgi:hypothetical protein
MKNEKIVLVLSVLLITSLSLALNFSYMARGEEENKVISGYIILMDQEPSPVYGIHGKNKFTSIIYLPSEYVEGSVTSCSFVFPSDVDPKTDLNEDGKIDCVDLKLIAKAYGCNETKDCWEETLRSIDCYFYHSEQRFKDPTRDCYIDQSDVDLIKEYYGEENTESFSINCDEKEVCRADVNKDGSVDIYDLTLVSSMFGEYSQEILDTKIKYKDCDVNADGMIDIYDVVLVGNNFNAEANEQKCEETQLEHLSGNEYIVSVEGRGLYYIGVSYLATIV